MSPGETPPRVIPMNRWGALDGFTGACLRVVTELPSAIYYRELARAFAPLSLASLSISIRQ